MPDDKPTPATPRPALGEEFRRSAEEQNTRAADETAEPSPAAATSVPPDVAGEPAPVPPIADEPSHLEQASQEPPPDKADDDERAGPRAGLPILSVGSFDPIVPELCAKLAELGYETPTSRGENPHAIIGKEEMQAARQFRRDHDVTDDPDAFAMDEADQHIGPWTIEAILSA